MQGSPRIKAEPAARLWALAVDVVFLGVVVFIVMVVSLIASTPFWDVDGKDGGHSNAVGVGSASVYALNDSVPSWVSWGIVALVGVLAVLMSGSTSRPGHRRSLGMAFSELRLVRWPVDLDRAFVEDLDEPGSVIPVRVPEVEIPPWDPATLEPESARVAVRWLLPYLAFAGLAIWLTGLGAALLVLAGWLPALWGGRRSVYDVVAGVAVVDGARLAKAATDARRR